MLLTVEIGRVRFDAAASVRLLPSRKEREEKAKEQAVQLARLFQGGDSGAVRPSEAPKPTSGGKDTGQAGYTVRAPQAGTYL